jgi:AraC-like DNA-binding protein
MKTRKSVSAIQPAAGPVSGPETSKRMRALNAEVVAQLRRLAQKRALKQLAPEVDPHELLSEQLKDVIHELIFRPKFNDLCNINDLLAKKTGYNYRYLSRVFSTIEKKTVERFIIEQKVEKVKDILQEGDYPLADIAFELNYSSVAHLSAQFKMITGETIREYRTTLRTARAAEKGLQ